MFFLPAWVLFLVVQVNQKDPSLANLPALPPAETFWDPQALALVVLWTLFQAVLYMLPVGKVGEEAYNPHVWLVGLSGMLTTY